MNLNLKFDRLFFQDVWRLLKPYWVSEEKWPAYLLLTLIIACVSIQVMTSLAFNQFQREFFDALQNFNTPLIGHLLLRYAMLLAIFVLTIGYNSYFVGLLSVRWRRWMTNHYLTDWLSQHTYYRMQVMNKNVDNPDQRISEDLDSFPSTAVSIFTNLLSSVLMLIVFGIVLWRLSGNLHVPVGTHRFFVIPGYLVWSALLYAIIGSGLMIFIGRILANLNYLQQRYNADFRFGMARLREVSEQVAIYHGEKVEKHKFQELFKRVFKNFVNIIKVQKRLMFFQNGYTAASFVVGLTAALPLFLAKKIQIGGMMQISQAFGYVLDSFSVFISLFTTFASWRSVIFRLTEFTHAMNETKTLSAASKIQVDEHAQENLMVRDLDLSLPDGTPLLQHINIMVAPGEMVLLTGQSGVGKSTLLRALAGIWPYGHGKILLPKGKSLLFLPQKPYLPIASLRDALFYPGITSSVDDNGLRKILTACGLEKFQTELEVVRNWAQELSLGEQQLIGFARVFLQKPDWLFLDEATSALDEKTEIKIYQALREYLPNITVLSVGHRSSLGQFHVRTIEFVKESEQTMSSELPPLAQPTS